MYKRTLSDYEDLAQKRNISLIGDMPNRVTDKARWQCSNGHQWDATYHCLSRGTGCPYCAGKATRKECEYYALAESRGFKIVGNIPTRTTDNARWQCNQGHIWSARYCQIQMGSGCRLCSKRAPKTLTDYVELAKSIGYTFEDELPKTTKTRSTWTCNNGHAWSTCYDSVRVGKLCPHCAGNARLTLDEYHRLAQSRNLVFVGELPRNVDTPVLWQCEKGHTWKAAYYNIQSGRNCPHCSWTIIESKGERSVSDALRYLGIEFEQEKRFRDCRDKRPLPFDFYFQYNGVEYLCEYNGAQHYRAIDRFGGESAYRGVAKRDIIKREWATERGYHLIIIEHTTPDSDILGIIQKALCISGY